MRRSVASCRLIAPKYQLKKRNNYLAHENIFYVLYSTLLHLRPLRFNCADGCWDQTQDHCNWCIYIQSDALPTKLDLIRNKLDLLRAKLDLIRT
jgi:hypothetical protein